MIVGEPFEELDRLFFLAAGNAGHTGIHVPGYVQGPLTDGWPVGHCKPHVVQHAEDAHAQRFVPCRIANSRHRHVLPGFHGAKDALALLHAQQSATAVAGDAQHRVDHQLDRQPDVAEHDGQ